MISIRTCITILLISTVVNPLIAYKGIGDYENFHLIETLDTAPDTKYTIQKNSNLEICNYFCQIKSLDLSNLCSCGVSKIVKRRSEISNEYKKMMRSPKNRCKVLCFIGQGGRMCKCNYAPFVGK